MRNRIAEIRRARGLTLQGLADRMQASNQQVSHLERGRRGLTVEWLERLAQALECHPFDLLDAPPYNANERERILVELFRELSPEQQKAFLTATAALTQPTRTDSLLDAIG
mgnify:CR=1 FL=1